MRLTYQERMKRLKHKPAPKRYVKVRTPEQIEANKKRLHVNRVAQAIMTDVKLEAKIAAYVLQTPEVPKNLYMEALRDVYMSWHLPRIPPLAPNCFVSGTRTGGYERVWIVPPHEAQRQLSTAA